MTDTRNAPAKRNMNQLLQRVDGAKDQIATYLPEGVKVERFMALARRAVAEQPRLAECNTVSVLRALSNCASSGLPLDGQFSSLIVRNSKNGPPTATWDPTYRGMISLAMSSGFVSDVQSFAVTEHDEFSVGFGTEPKITHVPALLQGGRIIAAYAWARLNSGRLVIEVLGRDDLDKIKRSSPAGEKGPWGKWEGQMARKSAVRRLLKKLPAAPIQALLASIEPQPAGAPAIDAIATEAPTMMPEDENVLECQALERLRSTGDVPHLQAAWAQCQVDYGQAGLTVPAAVTRAHDELLEALRQPPGASDDGWLDDYDNG